MPETVLSERQTVSRCYIGLYKEILYFLTEQELKKTTDKLPKLIPPCCQTPKPRNTVQRSLQRSYLWIFPHPKLCLILLKLD